MANLLSANNLFVNVADNLSRNHNMEPEDGIEQTVSDVQSETEGVGYNCRRKLLNVFEQMIETVRKHESHLLTEGEWLIFSQYTQLPPNARFLLVWLILCRQNNWHTTSDLESIKRDLGEESFTCILKDLCQPPMSVARDDLTDTETLSKEGQQGIIDTTSECNTGSICDFLPWLKLPTLEEFSSNERLNNFGTLNLGCFCEDESAMSLDEILRMLKLDDLEEIAQAMKVEIPHSDPPEKDEMVNILLCYAPTQVPMDHGPIPLSKLPPHVRAGQLCGLALKKLGKCVRVNPDFLKLIVRTNIIYDRAKKYPKKLLLPAIFTALGKCAYPEYTYMRDNTIWRTRDENIQYVEALHLEAVLQPIKPKHNPGVPPSQGGGMTGASMNENPNSATVPRLERSSRGTVATFLSTPGNIQNSVPLPMVSEESIKIQKAKKVKEYYKNNILPKWKVLKETKLSLKNGTRTFGLEQFESGFVYTRILYSVTRALRTLREYGLEAAVLEELIGQHFWGRSKRGEWYERRALVHQNYLYFADDEEGNKREQEVTKGIQEALEDNDTGTTFILKLIRRLPKRGKNLKELEGVRQLVEGELKKPKLIFIPAFKLENRHGRSMWLGRGGESVTVENRALEYYEDCGYKGFHGENEIWTTIFALLFWDIIFADVPGAFETAFQDRPLDMNEDSFYSARQELIEERLAEIKEGNAEAILEEIYDKHREKEIWRVGVWWDMCEKQDLLEIVKCLGGYPLSTICLLFCKDYPRMSNGAPDLVVWNMEKRECKFVEVKSPSDSLHENQELWIDALIRAGVTVELCKVNEEDPGNWGGYLPGSSNRSTGIQVVSRALDTKPKSKGEYDDRYTRPKFEDSTNSSLPDKKRSGTSDNDNLRSQLSSSSTEEVRPTKKRKMWSV